MFDELNVKNETMTEIQNVVEMIPTGRQNAVKGIELRQSLGISDRKLRELVSLARHDVCILNEQNGKGYYKPENRAEVEKWLKQEVARAKSILWSTKGAKEFLKTIE